MKEAEEKLFRLKALAELFLETPEKPTAIKLAQEILDSFEIIEDGLQEKKEIVEFRRPERSFSSYGMLGRCTGEATSGFV